MVNEYSQRSVLIGGTSSGIGRAAVLWLNAKGLRVFATLRRAKYTYFIGPNARLNNLLDKVLYGRLLEWMILRTLGLKDQPKFSNQAPAMRKRKYMP
jgi:hypothetical protein